MIGFKHLYYRISQLSKTSCRIEDILKSNDDIYFHPDSFAMNVAHVERKNVASSDAVMQNAKTFIYD